MISCRCLQAFLSTRPWKRLSIPVQASLDALISTPPFPHWRGKNVYGRTPFLKRGLSRWTNAYQNHITICQGPSEIWSYIMWKSWNNGHNCVVLRKSFSRDRRRWLRRFSGNILRQWCPTTEQGAAPAAVTTADPARVPCRLSFRGSVAPCAGHAASMCISAFARQMAKRIRKQNK